MLKRLPRTLVSITFIACWVLHGCAVKVNRSDLVGRWQMTEASVRLLKPGLANNRRPTVELHTDGTLFADSMPASTFSDIRGWQSRYSGSGKWSVPHVPTTAGFSVVVLQFDKIGEQKPSGLTMQVDKDGAGFYIFLWQDEEGGERLEFKR
jgi:hypothetical protein